MTPHLLHRRDWVTPSKAGIYSRHGYRPEPVLGPADGRTRGPMRAAVDPSGDWSETDEPVRGGFLWQSEKPPTSSRENIDCKNMVKSVRFEPAGESRYKSIIRYWGAQRGSGGVEGMSARLWFRKASSAYPSQCSGL
jgi:hypothetical protein